MKWLVVCSKNHRRIVIAPGKAAEAVKDLARRSRRGTSPRGYLPTYDSQLWSVTGAEDAIDCPGQDAPKADCFEQTANEALRVSARLLERRPGRFLTRVALAMSLLILSSSLMMSGNCVLFILGLLIQGSMYVHLVELQHSVLHLQVFKSHRLIRLVGFALGAPMLISFSDFQYRHLRHHKFLGTQQNTETFNYSYHRLDSVSGFVLAALDYSRCATIIQRLVRAFTSGAVSDGLNPLVEQRVRQEYRMFGLLLITAIVVAAITRSIWPVALWLLPLVVAEPVHFLLELPEHFGLPAHSNPSVFENTRSWGGSWFARWFSHNTNYHLAHHFNQLVPMDKLPELQNQLEPFIPDSSRSASYPSFYRAVIGGKIRPFGTPDN